MTKECNSALYHEICILHRLVQMGYLNQTELEGIIRIAAEDYGSNLVLDKRLLCSDC